jgi:hypothetical protein
MATNLLLSYAIFSIVSKRKSINVQEIDRGDAHERIKKKPFPSIATAENKRWIQAPVLIQRVFSWRMCGTDVLCRGSSSDKRKTQPMSTDAPKDLCHFCGEFIGRTAMKCKFCGKFLDDDLAELANQRRQTEQPNEFSVPAGVNAWFQYWFRQVAFSGIILSSLLALNSCSRPAARSTPPATMAAGPSDSEEAEVAPEQVQRFCTACHAFPPPESFPRHAWRDEVMQAYFFYERSNYDNPELRKLVAPPAGKVIKYFENQAPEELPRLPPEPPLGRLPVQFERRDVSNPTHPFPATANVKLVHLYDDKKLDLLVCDMRSGEVAVLKPHEKDPTWKVLAKLANPCHAEVVDLDGDGIKDLIVADLGSFNPTNDKVGKVVWLRGLPDGSFTPITLLDGLGRVADVQAADFNGDGKLDLIVAAFGWRFVGNIIYLENHTTDWSKPKFTPHVLDERHGTIHVPVCDLNKDGKPDFVALISQEHETIVAFINEGNARFRKETIYTAPHPAYGSSGIQLIDMNGDGNLDVLYINGDVLDEPFILKPYHGVQWLENKGKFPFERHPVGPLYGAMAGVAADFRGRGKPDIVAVSYLPDKWFPKRAEAGSASIIYFEQTSSGEFKRRPLELLTCDHATCAAGAWDGDGRVHLVTGNMLLSEKRSPSKALTLWRNLGMRK